MQARGDSMHEAAPPRTWVLLGEKAGDNGQVEAVADALGWPLERRRIAMLEQWRVGKPRVRASLDHVDLARSDALVPPWPDLVLAIGRRLSMVALWIRAQAGGRTRIVMIGQPRRLARRFDLIVVSAQYRGCAHRNVLRLELPLMRVDVDAVAAAAREWAPRLADLPRPLTAVFVGGPTKPVVLDAGVARTLAARAAAAAAGGTLYVTTSRRTPAAVTDALAASLVPPARLHRFGAPGQANPYRALLGLADRFVVTSDSVTMMVEVARLGRPLAIFPLPFAPGRFWRRLGSQRDLEAIPRLLIERGLAVWLGEPFHPVTASVPDELPAVVERISALFEPR
jgi:mitochondrial fission protein ELM1